MTFSIVGRAEGGDEVGVAVASKFLAALDEVSARLATLGFRPEGAGAKGVEDALTSWASMENLEMRYTGGPSVDPLVLDFLKEKSADRERR